VDIIHESFYFRCILPVHLYPVEFGERLFIGKDLPIASAWRAEVAAPREDAGRERFSYFTAGSLKLL